MYDEKSYLGFTVPEVDKILESYAEKSYEKYVNEYCIHIVNDRICYGIIQDTSI